MESKSQERVKMVATARQRYDGKPLYPGQEFWVENEADAADLCAINFARRAVEHAQPAKVVTDLSQRALYRDRALHTSNQGMRANEARKVSGNDQGQAASVSSRSSSKRGKR